MASPHIRPGGMLECPGMTPQCTTGSLAARLSAELRGNPDLPIDRLEVVERAGPGSLAFIRDVAYANVWKASKGTAALISRRVAIPDFDTSTRALIVVPDADLALNVVLDLFAPPATPIAPGRHPLAFIDPAATVAATAYVGPGCVIEAGARVGDGTCLKANVYLGRDAVVGRGCMMHAGVSILDRCTVGDGCTFFPGVVIGADGFGFRPSPDGRGVVKIPHIGNVEVGSGVEIGANSCVDRAKFGSTLVGAGTKIDNLVQVGHGVRIGRACLIAAGVGIGGSCEFGDGVMVGGQAGFADGRKIGAGARIGAQSGVMDNVPPGESWLGTPGMLAVDTLRDWANARRNSKSKASRQAANERPA